METLLRQFTDAGDIVLDPFMGSGTTGVACVRTGRSFIGIEIDPTYYAIAQRRIAEAQAQPSLLDAPRETFATAALWPAVQA
jgi:DNA modification methylase